jgi:hypothetical protein
VKKILLLVCTLAFGLVLGAGLTAWTDHPTPSVLQGEALGIALAATAKAHSSGDVPNSKDFIVMGQTMFPPSDGNVGLDAEQTYARGTNDFAFIFGKGSPQTYVCVTLPMTLGDFPQLTSCPS